MTTSFDTTTYHLPAATQQQQQQQQQRRQPKQQPQQQQPSKALRNLYFRNLPTSWNTAALRELCSPYGHIVSSKVLHHPKTNESLGYGFVLFETEAQAAACQAALHQTLLKVDGAEPRALLCRFAHQKAAPSYEEDEELGSGLNSPPSHGSSMTSLVSPLHYPTMDCQLAGGVPANATLLLSAAAIGGGPKAAVALTASGAPAAMQHPQPGNHTSVQNASSDATSPPLLLSPGSTPSLQQSGTSTTTTTTTTPAGESGAPARVGPPTQTSSKNVYVTGLPLSWNTAKLRSLCAEFGTIVSAKVANHSTTNELLGYGFVLFEESRAAAACVAALNDCRLPNTSCTLTCRFAKEKAAPSIARRLENFPSVATICSEVDHGDGEGGQALSGGGGGSGGDGGSSSTLATMIVAGDVVLIPMSCFSALEQQMYTYCSVYVSRQHQRPSQRSRRRQQQQQQQREMEEGHATTFDGQTRSGHGPAQPQQQREGSTHDLLSASRSFTGRSLSSSGSSRGPMMSAEFIKSQHQEEIENMMRSCVVYGVRVPSSGFCGVDPISGDQEANRDVVKQMSCIGSDESPSSLRPPTANSGSAAEKRATAKGGSLPLCTFSIPMSAKDLGTTTTVAGASSSFSYAGGSGGEAPSTSGAKDGSPSGGRFYYTCSLFHSEKAAVEFAATAAAALAAADPLTAPEVDGELSTADKEIGAASSLSVSTSQHFLSRTCFGPPSKVRLFHHSAPTPANGGSSTFNDTRSSEAAAGMRGNSSMKLGIPVIQPPALHSWSPPFSYTSGIVSPHAAAMPSSVPGAALSTGGGAPPPQNPSYVLYSPPVATTAPGSASGLSVAPNTAEVYTKVALPSGSVGHFLYNVAVPARGNLIVSPPPSEPLLSSPSHQQLLFSPPADLIGSPMASYANGAASNCAYVLPPPLSHSTGLNAPATAPTAAMVSCPATPPSCFSLGYGTSAPTPPMMLSGGGGPVELDRGALAMYPSQSPPTLFCSAAGSSSMALPGLHFSS